MAQETQTGTLNQRSGVVWEGGPKGRGYICIHVAGSPRCIIDASLCTVCLGTTSIRVIIIKIIMVTMTLP